jgi:hypothetical protein
MRGEIKMTKVTEKVDNMVKDFEKKGMIVTREDVAGWIDIAIDRLSKPELSIVTMYLIKNGNSLNTLLTAYSYIDSKIAEQDDLFRKLTMEFFGSEISEIEHIDNDEAIFEMKDCNRKIGGKEWEKVFVPMMERNGFKVDIYGADGHWVNIINKTDNFKLDDTEGEE